MEIIINGEALDLPSGFSIEIEDSNPIYNERGSQSIPATVPATRRNNRILSFPARIDAGIDPNNPERVAQIQDGAYIRRGAMNITEAGKKEGITFNIGFDNSIAYEAWIDKKLSELLTLPTYYPQPQEGGYRIGWVLDDLYHIYTGQDAPTDELAIFPIAVSKEECKLGDATEIYWEILNLTGPHGLSQPGQVNRIIDGEITEVSIPEGYAVSPFLKVWRLVELAFSDMGVTLAANPFRDDPDLRRMVVLNNTSDTVCRGEIRYADIVPDCTVGELLDALWVRFGLVYNINFQQSIADLRLLRDIIRANDIGDFSSMTTQHPKITYDGAQYVKLSASTSIDGASPSHERFEDFIKGLDVSAIRLGANVSQWTNIGTPEHPKWDGDMGLDFWDYDIDDLDYPDPADPDDPDDDRDDGRDPDNRDDPDDLDDRDDGRELESRSTRADTATNPAETTVAREFVSGTWYRLDAENGTVKAKSSSFFNWDPQPDGLAALELSSTDECVPICRVSNVGTGTGHSFNGLCPTYLFGARHYHSYIKGNDDGDTSGDSTPLAFMFAYTVDGKTIGRLTPEGDDGGRIVPDDGSTPTLSLLFQFEDGLFARFWADYDEILRHGNRYAEVSAVMGKPEVYRLDILSPVRYGGIRCLVDTMSYSLPASREVPVELKLRAIQPQGTYDIKTEQGIPAFSTTRHLEWRLKSEDYLAQAEMEANRRTAGSKYIADSGYQEHGTVGDYWHITLASIIPLSMARPPLTWQTDKTIPTPGHAGQRNRRRYKALAYYEVFEIHDMSTGPDDSDNWEFAPEPLGTVSVEVEYNVELVARWTNG